MSSILNAMFVPGNVPAMVLISSVVLIMAVTVVWLVKNRQKAGAMQTVRFIERHFHNLARRHRLNPKELEILRDYTRMEKKRRQEYYEYLNRFSRYF